jgi:hypothetical protein
MTTFQGYDRFQFTRTVQPNNDAQLPQIGTIHSVSEQK